jgi:hypothetical protein
LSLQQKNALAIGASAPLKLNSLSFELQILSFFIAKNMHYEVKSFYGVAVVTPPLVVAAVPPKPVVMALNLVNKMPLRDGKTATNIKPIAAAIRPYSIAVAPDSSIRKFFILKLQFY